MAKQCQITGKKTQTGGKYSNRVRATEFNPTGKVKRKPNLQKKSFIDPETGKKITLKVSARGIKIVNKLGIKKALAKAKK